MKIIMGSAVKGLALKNSIKKHLESQGHEIIDVGCYNADKFIKYTSVGERVAKALQDRQAELAINCCGSGTGAAMSVGKFKGVLACSCESVSTAKLIRVVNGANCLCMGESIVGEKLGCEMADAFINAKFQDAAGIPADVMGFWLEARDEMIPRGEAAKQRKLETLED
ncbi:MAG: RpiB/LacA/LacB family sugar-phosphate isomerase [Victivallales bacterium]